MADAPQTIQLQLTGEQQALIRRLSGQHAELLELVPEATDSSTGSGEGLRFSWRLSLTSGIPRQQWLGLGKSGGADGANK